MVPKAGFEPARVSPPPLRKPLSDGGWCPYFLPSYTPLVQLDCYRRRSISPYTMSEVIPLRTSQLLHD